MPLLFSILAVSLGTALGVDLLGARLIGIAITAFAALPELSAFGRLFVITGFLGALTTFSAEVFTQIQAGCTGHSPVSLCAWQARLP